MIDSCITFDYPSDGYCFFVHLWLNFHALVWNYDTEITLPVQSWLHT